jgi:hypothetical protein
MRLTNFSFIFGFFCAVSFEMYSSQTSCLRGVSLPALLTANLPLLLHEHLFAFWERSDRKNSTMRTIQSGIAAALGTAAIVATLTLAGGSVANAAATASTSSDQAKASCWADLSTGESICVPDGVDLISTVEADTGLTISIPAGTIIGGVKTSSGVASASLLSVQSTSTSHIVSAIYQDINYGGGTFFMTADSAGCDWGIPSLGAFGWNDRASSFKSYSGCVTALYQNDNYGGTRIGFSSYKSSLGSMNDAASSWATQ